MTRVVKRYIILLLLSLLLIGSASASDLTGNVAGANFALMHQSGQIVYNDTIDGYNASSLTYVDGNPLNTPFVSPTATQVQWGTGTNASTSDVLMTYGKNTTNILKGTIKLKSFHTINWTVALDNGEQIVPYQGGFRITGTGIAQEAMINGGMNGGMPAGIQIPAPTATDGNTSVNVWYTIAQINSTSYNIALNIGNETNGAPARYDLGGLVVDPSYYLSQYSPYLLYSNHYNLSAELTTPDVGPALTNNGVTIGTSSPTPAFGAGDAVFPGSKYLISSSSLPAIGTGDFTFVEYWYQPTFSTTTTFITANGATNGALQFGQNNVCAASLTCPLTFTSTPSNGVWHQTYITRKSGVDYGYLDGVPNGTAIDTENYLSSGFTIGASTGYSQYYTGEFDETALWDVSIPISQLYPHTQEIGTAALPVTISSNTTSGFVPLTVQFNDTSSWPSNGLLYANWSINNGTQVWNNVTVSGTNENISYTFPVAGTYQVNLTLTNNALLSNTSANTTITVTISSIFTASFTKTPSPGTVGSPISFTDTTSGPGSPYVYNWSFGDGSTSTLQNPTHTYASASTFTIWDNVTNSSGSWSNVSGSEIINAYAGPFTRQDLVMAPQYTLTVNFVDSVTSLPIPGVTVLDSNGGNYTAIAGTYTGTYPYQAIIIYGIASGYNSASGSYIVSGNLVETIVMTKSTTQNQNTNVVYTPTMVQFLIYDENMQPLYNTFVEATPMNFTAPANWTNILLGISPSCNILNTSVYGWTDEAGSWSAPMLASTDYSFMLVGTDNGNAFNITIPVYPVQSPVQITLPLGIPSLPNQNQLPQYGLLNTTINSTAQTIQMNYYDPSAGTTSLTFYVTNATGGTIAQTTYSGSAANSETFSQNISVVHGQSYTFGFQANQTNLGWINQSSVFTDPYISLLGNGTPGVAELWLASALLVILGAVGSIYFKHIILIAEPILYWFLGYYFGWVPLNVQAYLTIAVMLILGVLIYVRYRENLIQ